MSFNGDPNRTPEKGDSTRGCVYEDRDRMVGCRPPEEWVGRGSIEREDLGESLLLRRRGGRELERDKSQWLVRKDMRERSNVPRA